MNKINKRRPKDIFTKILIWFFSLITLGTLACIIGYIVYNGAGYISWDFITTINKPNEGLNGIFPMIISTFYMIAVTIVISTPIGVFTAVYLTEYSKPGKVLKAIRFAIETLSGIPSIIYGLFGFLFFVTLMQLGFSLISGALTLSIMVLPTIIRTTEEALKSVPVSYREGNLALGASRLATITRVVLPCAVPGILTSVVLSTGRIVGETAALIFTSGIVSRTPESLMSSGRTLALHLYLLAANGTSFEQAFATATILLIVVAIINFTSGRIAAGLKAKG